jgi:hypothetical protein
MMARISTVMATSSSLTVALTSVAQELQQRLAEINNKGKPS